MLAPVVMAAKSFVIDATALSWERYSSASAPAAEGSAAVAFFAAKMLAVGYKNGADPHPALDRRLPAATAQEMLSVPQCVLFRCSHLWSSAT